MKILLALDSSTKAMDEAVRLARERGAGLTALFVLDATWNDYLGHDWLSGSNARGGFLEYVRDNEAVLADETVKEFRRRAEAAGVPHEVKTAAGRVVEEIVAEAGQGYDLLVMAHPFKRGLEVVRDATGKALKEAPCSVHFAKE